MCGLGPVSPPPPRSCRCRGALPARSRAQCSVYTAVVAAAEAVPCSVVEPRLQHGHTHARDTADPRHEDVLGEQLVPPLHRPGHHRQARHRRWDTSASKSSTRRFVITEKAPTRAFSWLKAATTAFTFKTLLRHYAQQALTPRSLNVKLGPRRDYHKQ